ncbi:hypothetical protein [Celerinatantimonas sp. YJH-8]|uniref:hypothetical protein n=1 Tax=Celerinatantimonas sp. YJH-8 TaxID=3228714 RepID=UPI0038C29255
MTKEMMQIDNQIIIEIGKSILRCKKVVENEWDLLAVVFDVVEGHTANSGFLYKGNEVRPMTARIADDMLRLDNQIESLREDIYQQTGSKFKQLLVQMQKETGQIKIQFEFDDLQRWSFSPRNLPTIKEALRPDFS